MQLGGNMKPSRIRVLDLPFTAVEWVLPEEISPAQYLGQDKWIVWERSPLAQERSLFGYWDDTDDGQLAAAQDGAAQGQDTGHSSSSGMRAHETLKQELKTSLLASEASVIKAAAERLPSFEGRAHCGKTRGLSNAEAKQSDP